MIAPLERIGGGDGEGVGGGDGVEQPGGVVEIARSELRHGECAEEAGDHHHPQEEEPLEVVAQRFLLSDADAHGDHPMTDPSLKIGRYIAITRPPMTVPRKTMTSGSIRAVRLATALSTSSS